jgi:uncharacterized protein YjiS (DUF1127 family)
MEAVRSARGINSELTHLASPALERVVDRAVALREQTLGQLGESLFRRLGRWWHLQRTVSELDRLDDRILADVGLRRADLRALVEAKLRRR